MRSCDNELAQPSIPLLRRAIADAFQEVISFTNSVHILNDETSAFEHASELQIGLGACHGMDYPLHAGEFSERYISLRQ